MSEGTLIKPDRIPQEAWDQIGPEARECFLMTDLWLKSSLVRTHSARLASSKPVDGLPHPCRPSPQVSNLLFRISVHAEL